MGGVRRTPVFVRSEKKKDLLLGSLLGGGLLFRGGRLLGGGRLFLWSRFGFLGGLRIVQ
jgi:hypothetical protein